MAVGTYLHRRVAAERLEEHQTSFMTDQELFVAFLLLLSVFFPPVAVFLERGCGLDFLLNLLLTCLGFFPGILHALYLVVTNENAIHYNPSSYASPPPDKGSLTWHEVLRAASDEEREEKAKLAEKRQGKAELASVLSSQDDSDLEKADADLERVETGLTRAPTYRSTVTGPPQYEPSRVEEETVGEAEDEARSGGEGVVWSEKRRGKQREEDVSRWV